MHELEYIRKVLLERTKTTMFGSVGMPKYRSFYIHTAHASIEVRYMVNVGRPYIELDAHYHERSKRSRSGLVYDNFVDGIHAWVDNFNQECVREYSENLPNFWCPGDKCVARSERSVVLSQFRYLSGPSTQRTSCTSQSTSGENQATFTFTASAIFVLRHCQAFP